MTGAPGRALLVGLLLLAAGCGGGGGEIQRVIVVTLDTTRADRLGCYGYADARTPELDRFAAESVLFERAVSPAPTTMPSHSTMFTGLYPQDHGVRFNLMMSLGPETPTLAEALKDAGYATAAFPASFIVASRFGLDQGFDLYVEPPRSARRRTDPSDSIERNPRRMHTRAADDGVDQALAWLEEQNGKSFVWLHFYDPHWPYMHRRSRTARRSSASGPTTGEISYTDSPSSAASSRPCVEE